MGFQQKQNTCGTAINVVVALIGCQPCYINGKALPDYHGMVRRKLHGLTVIASTFFIIISLEANIKKNYLFFTGLCRRYCGLERWRKSDSVQNQIHFGRSDRL